jgi:hypothetical protein
MHRRTSACIQINIIPHIFGAPKGLYQIINLEFFMRRLIIEISEKELLKFGLEIQPFQKIESLEFLHFLRQDSEEFAVVSRVEFKDDTSKVEDLLAGGLLAEAQILEKEKSRTYIVFLKGGPSLSSIINSLGLRGYLFPPLEIRGEKLRITFLGSECQVSEFIKKITVLGIQHKVVLLTEANFSPDSLLGKLTEKQREVLIAAYKYGYYDLPRRINSEKLGEMLNIGSSTLGEHLRKAERRLLVNILAQTQT